MRCKPPPGMQKTICRIRISVLKKLIQSIHRFAIRGGYAWLNRCMAQREVIKGSMQDSLGSLPLSGILNILKEKIEGFYFCSEQTTSVQEASETVPRKKTLAKKYFFPHNLGIIKCSLRFERRFAEKKTLSVILDDSWVQFCE